MQILDPDPAFLVNADSEPVFIFWAFFYFLDPNPGDQNQSMRFRIHNTALIR